MLSEDGRNASSPIEASLPCPPGLASPVTLRTSAVQAIITSNHLHWPVKSSASAQTCTNDCCSRKKRLFLEFRACRQWRLLNGANQPWWRVCCSLRFGRGSPTCPSAGSARLNNADSEATTVRPGRVSFETTGVIQTPDYSYHISLVINSHFIRQTKLMLKNNFLFPSFDDQWRVDGTRICVGTSICMRVKGNGENVLAWTLRSILGK